MWTKTVKIPCKGFHPVGRIRIDSDFSGQKSDVFAECSWRILPFPDCVCEIDWISLGWNKKPETRTWVGLPGFQAFVFSGSAYCRISEFSNHAGALFAAHRYRLFCKQDLSAMQKRHGQSLSLAVLVFWQDGCCMCFTGRLICSPADSRTCSVSKAAQYRSKQPARLMYLLLLISSWTFCFLNSNIYGTYPSNNQSFFSETRIFVSLNL